MGSHPNITATTFPRQGTLVGRVVTVVFHHDLTNRLRGTVVRQDVQSPFVVLIQLEDGRYVEAGECQYHDSTDQGDAPHIKDSP